MAWKGLNKRVSATELDDKTSPDTVNCDFFEGETGHLGPRAGWTTVNTSAFQGRVLTLGNFNLPGNKFWIIGDDSGTLKPIDSARQGFDQPSTVFFTAANRSAHGTGDTGPGGGTALTITNPSTTGTTSWNTTATYTASSVAYFKGGLSVDATVASPSTTMTIALQIGVVISGTTTYFGTETFTLNRYALAADAGVHFDSQEWAYANTIASGTITALAVSVSVTWPTGAGAGDTVVITPILAG